jgi:hypothetical protein
MIGRRVPDGTEPHEYEPGDYGRWADGWYARRPSDEPRRLSGNLSQHDVTEHDDGTITVSPSILVTAKWASVTQTWHGYLERGVWREC